MAEEKKQKENEVKVEEEVKNENISKKENEKDTSSGNSASEKNSEKKESKRKKTKKDKKESIIEELTSKLEAISDKHLRLQAEFDNFRRRTLKEKADLIKTGGESVLINILPVVDDFERALDSLKEVADDDAGKQVTVLIYNKLQEILKQNNVKEIEAINQDFDVDHHEAITKIPAPSEELKGKVVDVIQKGYLLNEKVIRFAKVVVGE
ncbi:MAG: nucleotide exchange factor GrpE [Prolixibacteraceae bacterium]|nr:nucleotide exchange factor GrpE [Prolixibacteraceae bacterium]